MQKIINRNLFSLHMSPMARRDFRNGILFVLPWFIGFAIFIAYPLVSSLYFSFTNFNIMKEPHLIGLANYGDLFLNDSLFHTAISNTLIYLAMYMPLSTVFSIGIAMLLNQRLPGITIFRSIFYIPSIVPAVASSIIWLMLLNPQFGILNSIIRLFGLPVPGWLGDPNWAKPSLVLMSTWTLGGTMIIYLAALQDVPEHLIEAAILDGSNRWQRFTNVILPMISPAILFNVITGLIGGFQYFTASYIMTSGGPNNSTLFYALYLFLNAFKYMKMGYASAQAWILVLITLACTLIVMRTSARFIYYGGDT